MDWKQRRTKGQNEAGTLLRLHDFTDFTVCTVALHRHAAKVLACSTRLNPRRGPLTPAVISPRPTRWFCEGRELHNSPDVQIWRDGDLHTLVISEAFEDDTGRYTCVASNSIGADNTSAEVYVEGQPSSRRHP